MKFWYSVPDSCEESRYEFSTHYLCDVYHYPTLAEECARDYYRDHDGWESDWPLVIALHESEDGPEIARYRVELELEPSFLASEVK